MKNQIFEPEDANLRVLLRDSRATPALPAGFQRAVWHRIEKAEAAVELPSFTLLERLANLLIRPKWALAALTGIVLLGAASGVVRGVDLSKQALQQRYVSAISPLSSHP